MMIHNFNYRRPTYRPSHSCELEEPKMISDPPTVVYAMFPRGPSSGEVSTTADLIPTRGAQIIVVGGITCHSDRTAASTKEPGKSHPKPPASQHDESPIPHPDTTTNIARRGVKDKV
ncbi:hypothetical protein AC579_9132 [Pseudocercospora musae]|uniref:Uncharacterized protein n=1 Tax=Pseudocercospora musae TaxID=113226 RepID=A0A139IJ44_9PEZI|nr:hypothetical protein AC579_9132 [Pseudocercospora musae]